MLHQINCTFSSSLVLYKRIHCSYFAQWTIALQEKKIHFWNVAVTLIFIRFCFYFLETWDVITKLERLRQCVAPILYKLQQHFPRKFIIIDAILLGIICIPEMHVWRSIKDNKTGHVENWDIKCYLNFLLNINSLSSNASISQICNERVFPKDHKVFIVLSVEYTCISNKMCVSHTHKTHQCSLSLSLSLSFSVSIVHS